MLLAKQQLGQASDFPSAAQLHQHDRAPTLGQCCLGSSTFKSHQLHLEAVCIVGPRCCVLLHAIRLLWLLLRLLEIRWIVHRLLLLLGLLLDIPPSLSLWCIRVHHTSLLLLLLLGLVVLLLLLPRRRLLLWLLRGVILLLLWLL